MDKKRGEFDFEGWEDYFSEVSAAFESTMLRSDRNYWQATPGQDNAYDCGVFTCQFMEALSRGEDAEDFAFSQKNMSFIRRRMVWEIGSGTLVGWAS